MDRRLLVGLAILLLLLLGIVVFRPQPAPPAQVAEPKAAAQQPVRDFLNVSADTCCEWLPDPSVNDKGQIVVTFPGGVNLSNTMVYAFRPGESKPLWIQVGGGGIAVASGIYDIEVQKVRFTNVNVRPGQDTRVKAGALRVTADQSTTYEVWDAAQTLRLAAGYGRSEFGLPAGSYVLKMSGQVLPITVSDGQVTDR